MMHQRKMKSEQKEVEGSGRRGALGEMEGNGILK